MRKEVILIGFVFLFVINLSFSVSAECNEVEKITPDSSVWQGYPAIYEDKIIWTKNEINIQDDYWNNNLYVYDIQTGSSNKITSNLGAPDVFEYSSKPRIYEDKIILKTDYYQKMGGSFSLAPKPSLSLYDLSSGQKIQLVDYDNENRPKQDYVIYGNKVAWIAYEDSSGDNVYLYDISNKITTKITNETNYRPANIDIYENNIIWTAWHQPFDPSAGTDVYLYNSGSLTQIIRNVSQSTHLQIYENKIAYMKYNPTKESTYGNSKYDLHIYDLGNGQDTLIDLGTYSDLYIDPYTDFRMDADKIIFPLMEGPVNEKGIFVYDLNDKTTIKLEDTNDDKRQVFSDTQDRKFVWVEWKYGTTSINSIKFYNMICCVSNCTNKECGNNGCGGICGSCEGGELCSNGVCVSGGGIECNDNFDCMIDAVVAPYCENNSVCINSVSYDCINPGTTQSYCDSTLVKNCTSCDGECEDNQCISSPSPEPIITTSCETIGLRENQKYCSPNKIWRAQLSESRSCENDFECESNNCLDSICGGKKPLPFLFYFLIGLIGLVIILVIFLLIRSKAR